MFSNFEIAEMQEILTFSINDALHSKGLTLPFFIKIFRKSYELEVDRRDR